ncbi:TetR family transcriptional regulator [Salimicrobium sp. PL1-032A]|uniref:TetR/AcrR family transcriptional regulator n=1 Tax=Salimicrobium sp. PL1-032A TaxID=3095364 RepID=UPI003261A523
MKKFDMLEEEKKTRVLEAALLEFAEEGYEKASTNNIVKQAGSAKGCCSITSRTRSNCIII